MSQSQAIYPPPKHITENYNPLDFYDKNEKKTSIVGLDLAVPKIDKGVTYYDSTTQKLKNNSNFLYTESTGYLFVASRVGINNANPTEALDVTGNAQVTGNLTIKNSANETVALVDSSSVTINKQTTVNANLQTIVNNSGFTSAGDLTSVSNTSDWNLQIINQGSATRCGVAFSIDSADPTTTKPSADIYYTQQD